MVHRLLARASALLLAVAFASPLSAYGSTPTLDTSTALKPIVFVDFNSLHVRDSADLYAKLGALPKDSLIRFAGRIDTVAKLLTTLRRRHIQRQQTVDAPPQHVDLSMLNSHTIAERTGLAVEQNAPKISVITAKIALPQTQANLGDAAHVCPTQTLCAIYDPTYTYSYVGPPQCAPFDFGCANAPFECVDANGNVTAKPQFSGCPQGTTSPAAQTQTVTVGGCHREEFTAADPIQGPTVDDCAWKPIQTADVTIADSFALDHYDASAACSASGFNVSVLAGKDDGVARTIHMRIAQPKVPAEPLAQEPANPENICAVTVYIVGPKGGIWQF